MDPSAKYNAQVHEYMISRDQSETASIAASLASAISSDKIKLVQLVQFLGDYLTDEKSDTRASAIACIAQTIAALPTDKLAKSQVSVILSFFSDRLDDSESIKPVLQGLLALIPQSAFSSSMTLSLLDSIKSNTTPRQYPQVARFSLFSILESLFSKFPSYIESIPDTFITTFLHVTTGEKDPRNLIKSFNLSYSILSNQSFQQSLPKYALKLFDVSFCYFPITFEPPKNDPYGITSKDLKDALRKALAANGLFADHIFSSLMDKMASSSPKIKSDALETIVDCIQNYRPEYLVPLWRDIWDGLKYEVLHGSEQDSQDLSLQALRTLAISIEDHNEDYLVAVINETKDTILDTTNKKSLAAATLAAGIAQGSLGIYKQIASQTLAPALDNALKSLTLTAQKHLLTICQTYITAAKDLPQALISFKDAFIEFFTKSLMSTSETETEVRVLAVSNLTLLIRTTDYLTSQEVGLIVQYFDEIIFSSQNNKPLSDAVLDSLVQVASHHEQSILSITYPFFLSKLPDSDASEEDQLAIGTILTALSKTAVSRNIFEVLSFRLLNKLDLVIADSSSKYPLAIFSTIAAVLKRMLESHPQDALIYVKQLAPLIVQRFLKQKSLSTDPHVIISASLSLLYISKALQPEQQIDFVQSLFNLFWFNKQSPLGTPPQDFTPLKSTPSALTTLFLYGLVPVSPKATIPEEITQVLPTIVTNSVTILSTTQDVHLRLTYLRLIALLFNKWIPTFAAEFVDPLKKTVTTDTSALEVLFWITKALVIRTDAFGFTLVQYILTLLQTDLVGVRASKLAEVLVSDDGVLNKENGAVVRLLYKQRLFVLVIDPLVQGFESAPSSSIKVNYLVALAGILRHMPSSVLSAYVPKFFRLLLQSLSIPNARVREASINTITSTLLSSDSSTSPVAETISQHLSTLVPQLLDATNSANEASPQVRVAALRCLDSFVDTLPRVRVVPHVKTVQRGLAVALDDGRRGVRRVAVVTRQKYFELKDNEDEE
ncbi:uncharacterized protein SAPINGB_P004569 [Magnusiomyces paraingens]|uniref:MMS19 nucleotide excision repair protein n=1 Tax=Magnusiomyces paraingens TaxID=2606893 RepID=A0A5E8BVC1_9ASCO|nr:uncharacterized protein SAPINGB_P004569 [Saprochaete ingens]VVT55383.1 unnamed protein product [Saprochaete ingens]